MIIEELKNDIEIEGEIEGGIKAGIDLNNLSYLFQMLAERYSDKYSSIVREYTCNALDSHTEAGVTDKNVIVSLDYDYMDEIYKLKIQDFGVGLSPDRMNKIFVNYLSSTKRNTNDLIGGFGIGSKSMFSYTDSFFIRTVFDGIEYLYIMHKGKNLPILEPINNTPTDEGNGSTFIMNIESGDYTKFSDAIETQLCFFKNVTIVKHKYVEPQILEFNNFKLNDKIKSPSILIDDVVYPLSIKIMNHYIENPFGKFTNIPKNMCFKFKTGDFKVNLTREDIMYEDGVEEKLFGVINKALAEFEQVINKEKIQFLTPSYKEYKQSTTYYNIRIKDILFDSGQVHKLIYKPFYDIGFQSDKSSSYGETSDFGYIYNSASKHSRRRRSSNNNSKSLIINKKLNLYETEYYKDYNLVNEDKDYRNKFRKYLYNRIPFGFPKITTVDKLYNKIKKEYQIYDFTPVPQHYIDEYKLEQKELKEANKVKSNYQSDIIYRDSYNSIHRLYVKSDVIYVYSYSDDIFELKELMYHNEYKQESRIIRQRGKVTKVIKSINDKYLFIKLNDTNFTKCVRNNVKLYDINDFINLEPDLIRCLTTQYLYYKNRSNDNLNYYRPTSYIFTSEKNNKKNIKENNVKRFNRLSSQWKLDDTSCKYLFAKQNLALTNINKHQVKYLYSELFKTKQKSSYLVKFVEKYHDFKYLHKKNQLIKSRMFKEKEEFDVFNYFNSYAPISFVSKNIKHLRKVNYSKLIKQYTNK